ncbi:MAG: PaaI family thioesterase, partial [Thermodesulfobacteriota bacterium]
MLREVKPLAPEVEAVLREKLANNPFVRFMGLEVPELGEGFARFTLEIRPDFHNSQGFLQGGVIAALADEAVAYALFSLV